MTTEGSVDGAPVRNRLSPKKLLLTKWTAAAPVDKEKHFIVTSLVEPAAPARDIGEVEIAAVHTGRVRTIAWRELLNASVWLQGWR